ncbi:MAG: hypothetical protein U0235_15940 [Polyangiaceae bacterium]
MRALASLALFGTVLTACASAPPAGAAAAPPSAANEAPSAAPARVDVGALVREVEARGLSVFGERELEGAFAKKGNVAVSWFAAGLTAIVADAAVAPDPNAFRRFAPVVSTAAACFGAALIEHRVVLPESAPPSRDATAVTALLTPGQHRGVDDDPSAAIVCAAAYSPIRSVATPSMRDLRPVSPSEKAWPHIEGTRLVQSTAFIHPRFARCADVSVDFHACGEPPPNTADLLARAASGDAGAPPGIEITARAHVERAADATLFAVGVDQPGVPLRGRRAQTLVLALPKSSCDGSLERLAGSLAARARDVVAKPRDEDVRVRIPDIATKSDFAAKVAPPVDAMLVSATVHTELCPSRPVSSAGPPRAVFDRPFAYAVIDDETRAVLVVGRFSELDRTRREAATGSAGKGGAGRLAPIGGGR